MMIFYILALILILIFILSYVVYVIQYGLTLYYGAPYVKSSDNRTRKIIKLLNPKPGEKIIDLGSGNEKLLFEIQEHGAKAFGIEINPFLVWITKRQINQKKIKNIYVKRGNLFHENLSKYDKIVLYGITYLMPKLEKKLRQEAKPGTIIVSNFFRFPNLKPTKKDGDILLYKINDEQDFS